MKKPIEKAPRDGRTLSRVRAVSRAVAILRSFSAARPRLTLGEVSQITGLDLGTIRRILITLRDEGLVQQDRSSGLYSLSLGVLELGGAVPDSVSLRDVLEGQLISLAGNTGATVYLSILAEDKALCLARYHGKSGIEVRWWSVGETMPLNCGAGPRVLFAHMNPDMREHILAGELPALTELSESDSKRLAKELDAIAKRGWAATQDDVAVGLSALAVPLKNGVGEVIAAISIGGLTPQISGKHQTRLLELISSAVVEMEQLVKNLPAKNFTR